ncbi:MAG: hypothetical protein IKH04_01655 [Kiritimatiellae bacterium]|nr:hypothetical protein [Kiritimatiellia bacterium]
MKLDRTTIAALATIVASTATLADDLYLNDFATRTSKEPIPATGVWQTAQPYPAKTAATGITAYNNGSTFDHSNLATYFSTEPYNAGYGRPTVDGWVTPWMGNGTRIAPYWWPKFSGSLAEDPVLTWYYPTATATGGEVVHDIHNEFTNGLLRIQVDMKAPVVWLRANDRMSVFPVYRKYMDVLAWEARGDASIEDLTPGKVGIRDINTGTPLSTTYAYWSNNSGWHQNNNAAGQLGNNFSGNFGDDGSDGKTNYWFRYIVTYDLDANTFGGELYRFSKAKGHPLFDTEPSDTAPYQSFSGQAARTPLSAATGGIAGLGVGINGSFQGRGAANAQNKPFIDNIRISWKAPGASDFEACYENDFETRRYRTLCAGTTSTAGAYAQSTATVTETDSFSGYTAGIDNQFITSRQNSTAPNPVGFDGWRRLPYYAGMYGRPAAFAYGGNSDNDSEGTGGNMLSFSDQSGACRLVQTLGTSFSSGTVRVATDIWLPRGAGLKEQTWTRRVGVGLGSAALYEASRPEVPGELAAGFGYERLANAGESSHRPYTIASDGIDDEPARVFPSSYSAPESNCWFRVEVSADIETQKYGVTVTSIGATSITASDTPAGPVVFSESGIDFAANVSDIGSFYLVGYGYGTSDSVAYKQNRVCFDNIRVWHDDALVYENDFTTRTRTLSGVTRETGDLAALQYNLDGGQDHWVRRDYTGPAGFDARAWVRDDGGNQFLALGRSAEAGRTITLVNGLGVSQRKPFRFEADIRPPRQWSAASGSATISLGDSQMLQTEAPESVYGAHRLVSFGFAGTNAANQAVCPYYFAGCTAQVGGTTLDADIDETHWYRFRLEVDPEGGTCDAKLYDMGTAHPTAETKGGTLVATATDIAFENALASGDGVSTILIEGDGLSGAVGSLGVDPAHVLIDNLRLSAPSPFMMLVR